MIMMMIMTIIIRYTARDGKHFLWFFKVLIVRSRYTNTPGSILAKLLFHNTNLFPIAKTFLPEIKFF